jgi:hypothetical protein
MMNSKEKKKKKRKKNTFRGEVAVTAKMEVQNEKWRLKTMEAQNENNNNNKAPLRKKEIKKMKGGR